MAVGFSRRADFENRFARSINDNAALGRVTTKPDVTSEELEATPMQVEQLGTASEPFVAARVAAGDSVSLAISDHGDLRAWGSFRVRSCSRSRLDPWHD